MAFQALRTDSSLPDKVQPPTGMQLRPGSLKEFGGSTRQTRPWQGLQHLGSRRWHRMGAPQRLHCHIHISTTKCSSTSLSTAELRRRLRGPWPPQPKCNFFTSR